MAETGRKASDWHVAVVTGLLLCAALGVFLVLPLVLLVPVVLLVRAENAWRDGRPDAFGQMGRAHSTTMALLAIVSLLCVAVAVGVAFHEWWQGLIPPLFVLTLSLSMQATSWLALRALPSHAPSPPPAARAAGGEGIQARPKEIPADPDDDGRDRRLGDRVDWHRFATVLLVVFLQMTWVMLGSITMVRVSGVNGTIPLDPLDAVVPLASLLLVPITLCITADVCHRGRLGWLRAAHTIAMLVALPLAGLAAVLTAVVLNLNPHWWGTSSDILTALSAMAAAWLALIAFASARVLRSLPLLLLFLAGCGGPAEAPDLVWGKKGVRDGDLARPRAAVVDADERLWVVDFTARVQAFGLDGKHLGRTWQTPDYRKGRPSGLSLDNKGRLVVSDSHYHCFRIYSPEGEQLRVIGLPAGREPGQLAYVCDVVQDAEGFWYVAEFGEAQRITKLDADGRYLTSWGREGNEPGQFARLRALALGPDGLLYAADACNHRIQVFTRDGSLVRHWGTQGEAAGELHYPYDLAFDAKGHLFVAEFGNHRVQKFTADGRSLGVRGGPGREPGRLHSPWGLAVDRLGRVHVLDTENHRVQRFTF